MSSATTRLGVGVLLVIALSGCDYEEDTYGSTPPTGWFSVDSWSGGDPVVIDPYAQDGLFQVSWRVDASSAEADLHVSLGEWSQPTGGDLTLFRGRCGRWSSCGLDDYQVYQYDSHNILWSVDEWGNTGWLADLTGWSPYQRVLYLHFEACDPGGYCTTASRAVVLW